MPKNFRAISTSILPGQSGSRIRETTPGLVLGVYCGEKEAQDFIDFIKKKLKTNANVQQSRPDPTQLIQIRFTRVPSAINRVAELSILFFTFPITLASQFNYSLVSPSISENFM
jgi:hypothetical protein